MFPSQHLTIFASTESSQYPFHSVTVCVATYILVGIIDANIPILTSLPAELYAYT
jgi:hypothetical protein